METFSLKSKIYFGQGSIEYLDIIKDKRAFIVTDPFMFKNGFVEKIIALLDKNRVEFEIFSDIVPDPSVEIVASGVKKMQSFKPDVVIALGGGSSIDAAKSILIFTFSLLNKRGCKYERPLFIAIPTTSGTGSEVTAFSVITVGNTKFPLVDEDLIPDAAIVDADFVKTVPSQITADTALDVLTHAIEAYVSTKASDYTDALAEKAVVLVFKYLLRAYENGGDIEAREKLHNASCMAGIAFTNASLGINHSLAHSLGAVFHIPHGRLNALLQPYVIRYNATEAARKYANLARIIGLPCSSVEEGVNSLICAVNLIMLKTNTPMNLKETKVEEKSFSNAVEAIAEAALRDRCTTTNPRIPNKKELINLLNECYGI